MQNFNLAITLLLSAIITAKASDTVWSFEEQTPGEVPRGWGRMWGEQGDDQVLISNITAAVGENSMLLDRGRNTKQWGIGAALPEFDSGWLQVAFSFMVDGSASAARVRFGFLLRNQVPPRAYVDRALGVRFHKGTVYIQPHRRNTFDGNKIGLARFQRDKWYRITLWWPAESKDDNESLAWARMERISGGWMEPVGKPLRVNCVPARTGRMEAFIQLNTWPGEAHNNFKAYFDDFEARQVHELPEFLNHVETVE